MTSSIGPLAGLGAVAVLLAVAVRSRNASPLARMLIALGAFTGAWLVTAVSDAMHAPGWTICLGGVMIVLSITAIVVTLHRWTQAGDGDERPRRDDRGDGGSRGCRPDSPRRGSDGSDPSWWPAFELQFALYVAETEGKRRRAAALPDERRDRRSYRRADGTRRKDSRDG